MRNNDIRIGGGYLPEQVPAAVRDKIDALVAEYSRREELPLHVRIELLDQVIREELSK